MTEQTPHPDQGASRAEVERIMDEMDPAYAGKQAAAAHKHERRSYWLGVLAAVILIAVGYGIITFFSADSEPEPVAQPTPTPPAATAPPTEPEFDLSVVPDPLTVEFVQASMDEAFRRIGAANRYAIESRDLEDPEIRRLHNLGGTNNYTDLLFEIYAEADELGAWPQILRGDPRGTISSIERQGAECLIVRGAVDGSRMLPNVSERDVFIALSLTDDDDGLALEPDGVYPLDTPIDELVDC